MIKYKKKIATDKLHDNRTVDRNLPRRVVSIFNSYFHWNTTILILCAVPSDGVRLFDFLAHI